MTQYDFFANLDLREGVKKLTVTDNVVKTIILYFTEFSVRICIYKLMAKKVIMTDILTSFLILYSCTFINILYFTRPISELEAVCICNIDREPG